MKNGLFTLLACLTLTLGGCATFFELDGGDRDPASADRGYTEEDDDASCSGRFCEGAEQSDEEAQSARKSSGVIGKEEKRVRRAIAARDVVLGMTRQEVSESWGEPYYREVAGSGSGGHERWVYGSRYSLSGNRTVIFENGKVAGWGRE